METQAQAFQPRTFSIKLWPPSSNTRQILVERMIKNLSTESIFSRKYGLLSKEEALENAKRIEDTCFAIANDNFEKEPDGDGSSAVQLYAKETSEEALELLKPLREEGDTYSKICFSNRSFGVDAARVAEPILASLKKQLVEVDLSDFIAARPEDEAIEVMRIFSSALEGCALKYLNLSNNAMGEKELGHLKHFSDLKTTWRSYT
ncbi:hypothetical protein HPP92_020189 [Vanilla planifolia]|uniref:WPP domain-containing protein n=1 Tax=Vanilla planifolia TaxID=51239 RepID=A0A835Q496_VANPL|nr:hypothetical protein HPP92_020189 [Vanilla planifolia]